MLKLMKNRKGMTLIEIMIVVTILGVILTLVGSRVYKQFARSKVKTTQLSMLQLKQAMTEYQMDHYKFPDSGEGLNALLGDYIEKIPTDGWGKELHYEIPGPSGQPFDITSDGPDGQSGSGDDLRLSEMK